jgi:serine/threonine protein kinase
MSDQPLAPEIAAGVTLGHYAILSTLGKGGMGEVFLAHDTKLDRLVAVKVLPARFASDASRLKRFEVEAKALAALSHPNIVSVFAIEETGGRLVLVMEFVDGKTLRQYIRPGGMALVKCLEIAVSLADAIGAAHARGVLHRDLKPENIMMTASGWVKILDFGLAKFRTTDAADGNDVTRAEINITGNGCAMGTAPYMSPEQVDGGTVDYRSDIFALGVVFYEMLTDVQPFRGRTPAHVLTAILRDEPPRMSALRHDIPPELCEVLSRCLRKNAAERFASAADLQRALKQVLRKVESGALLALAVGPPVVSAAPSPWVEALDDDAPFGKQWQWLDSRWGITAIIAGLWAVNWIETSAEELWSVRDGSWAGYDLARALWWLEGGLTFERHDLASALAVYLGSIAYFFVPIVLMAFTLLALVPRRSRDGYRIFAFAIATCYALSVPFYLWFPAPERWAYPDSQAILLSDLWSAQLIQTIRPISGLDNCFPSFHVSGTSALVLVWYVLRLRYRHAIACLGAAVVLSTFLLGIHWVADIIAGLAVAMVSLPVALWMNRRVRERLAG